MPSGSRRDSAIEIRKLSLDKETIRKIVDLRKQLFVQRFGSAVDSSGLEFNQCDLESLHWGAFFDDEMVSTLRLTRIETKQRFQDNFLFDAEDPFVRLPCFALARAATSAKFTGQSLSMILRAEVYRHILSEAKGEGYVYGTALSGSKRLQFLKSLGYEVMLNPKPWSGFLKSDSLKESPPPALFRIEVERLSDAIRMIEEALSAR